MTRHQRVVVAVVVVLPLANHRYHDRAFAQAREEFCGRVAAVSCEGPSSPVTLLLAVPQGNGLRRIVIPPERRSFFGTRIEHQYEERAVCVSSYAASARSDPLTVLGPDELTVTAAAEPSVVLPDDVFRTCDADVRPPIAIHTEHAQFTPDAMRAKVTGSVVLQGVVAADGSVRNVRVVQPLEPSLDAAARGAFLRWRFRPAMRAEQPVPMAVTVQMAFTMR